MVNFPASLDVLSNPTSTTKRNDPGFELHSVISTLNDIAEAVEAKLGVGGSTPVPGSVLRGSLVGTGLWDTKLLLGSGSASAPTFSYDGDPDTGAYDVSADVWGVAAGGQLVAQFKRSGSGLLGVKIGSATFSETIGGDGDLFVGRGLNVGSATVAGSGEVRASAGLYLSNQTSRGLIAVTLPAAFPNAAAIVQTVNPIGLLFVSNNYDGASAIFSMRGVNTATLIAGDATTYSATSGTASRLNVYRDGATSKIFYQNNISGTIIVYGLAWTNVTS